MSYLGHRFILSFANSITTYSSTLRRWKICVNLEMYSMNEDERPSL